MMPECAFREMTSIRDAMSRFGVSRDAACFRARALKMTWLIREQQAACEEPKKRGTTRAAPLRKPDQRAAPEKGELSKPGSLAPPT